MILNDIFINDELLPEITEITFELGKEILDLLSTPSVSYSQPRGNDHWFTCSNGRWGSYNGQVLSMYYHEYKRHSATTCGKLGEKRSIADAGHWAISYQTRRFKNNTAYFNDDVDIINYITIYLKYEFLKKNL